MRTFAALFLIAFALTAEGTSLGTDGARHLLARTGFGPTRTEVEAFAQKTREAAVKTLLEGAGQAARTPPPQWIAQPLTSRRETADLSPEERKAFQEEERTRLFQLKAWWLNEMLTTPSPLTERMTLLWHNHFASSHQKVKPPQLMYRQNLTLRRHALGNFAALLHAIAKDTWTACRTARGNRTRTSRAK
jgi:uncharacterized protein (DUF1800 family)